MGTNIVDSADEEERQVRENSSFLFRCEGRQIWNFRTKFVDGILWLSSIYWEFV